MADGLGARLKLLLAGRPQHPWAKRLAISSGTMDNMIHRNTAPRADALQRIKRAENASPSWLLDGDHPPFRVSTPLTDADAAEWLQGWLKDGDWRLVLAAAPGPVYAVVLDRPAQVWAPPHGKTPGKWVDYTEMKILGGPACGQRVLETVAAHVARLRCRLAWIDTADWARIAGGELGTYKLLKAPDATLADERLMRIEHADRLEEELWGRRTADVEPGESTSGPPAHQLGLAEHELLSSYWRPDPRNRRRAIRITQVLTEEMDG